MKRSTSAAIVAITVCAVLAAALAVRDPASPGVPATRAVKSTETETGVHLEGVSAE